jgi:hypothetical protein
MKRPLFLYRSRAVPKPRSTAPVPTTKRDKSKRRCRLVGGGQGRFPDVEATGIRRGTCPILNCYQVAAIRFLESARAVDCLSLYSRLPDSTLSKSQWVVRHTNERGSTTKRRTRCSMFY